MAVTRSRIRLACLSPATIARPPLSSSAKAPADSSRRSPPSCLSGPWQAKHFLASSGWISREKSTGAACTGRQTTHAKAPTIAANCALPPSRVGAAVWRRDSFNTLTRHPFSTACSIVPPQHRRCCEPLGRRPQRGPVPSSKHSFIRPLATGVACGEPPATIDSKRRLKKSNFWLQALPFHDSPPQPRRIGAAAQDQ